MERSRTGHAAGLRTTLLVTLAISMIQMNLLIPTNGKPNNSYAVMDLMRLPLRILTGVGFIGTGATVRKDELVLGLTTAATLWFATVVGLCMGGGQVIPGSASTIIGFGVINLHRSGCKTSSGLLISRLNPFRFRRAMRSVAGCSIVSCGGHQAKATKPFPT